MENFIERRKLPRLSVSWPVTLYTAAGETEGMTRDLTSTGAYIQCRERLKLHEECWLQIEVPHRTLMLKGKVIWSNLIIDESGTEVSRMGLSFLHIESDDRMALRDAILGDQD
jgi:Tfp pilus assembly protein PilZ